MAQYTSSTMGSFAGKWLVGIGLLLLLLAAAFAVGIVFLPEAAFGFILTAAILGVTGLILFLVGRSVNASAAEADRIQRTGLSGRARVMGLTQTGMYLNENPQVEMSLMIDLPGRPGYSTTHKQFVPLILLGRLSSGEPLPVKVDPQNLAKLVIDWPAVGVGGPMSMPMAGGMPMGGGGMAAMAGSSPQPGDTGESMAEVSAALRETGMSAAPVFAQAEQGQYTVEQLRQYLRTNGIPATATINRLRDSGRTVGDERLFTMQCTLNVPGRPPQELAESAAMVPMHAASKLHIGQTLPVFVAPDNPNMLTFAWEQI